MQQEYPQLFDVDFYLQKNPDLRLAVQKYQQSQHWGFLTNHFFTAGRKEGRKYRFLSPPTSTPTLSVAAQSLQNSANASAQRVTSSLPTAAPRDSYQKLHRKEKINVEEEQKLIKKLIASYHRHYIK
jgi:hypothetical protein